jgi:acyl-coenzyme A synthetase/AMP-(fatty) acid ligase
VLRDGSHASAEELRRHCAGSLSRHQVPKRFEFAPQLPRTASGKLLRRALR